MVLADLSGRPAVDAATAKVVANCTSIPGSTIRRIAVIPVIAAETTTDNPVASAVRSSLVSPASGAIAVVPQVVASARTRVALAIAASRMDAATRVTVSAILAAAPVSQRVVKFMKATGKSFAWSSQPPQDNSSGPLRASPTTSHTDHAESSELVRKSPRARSNQSSIDRVLLKYCWANHLAIRKFSYQSDEKNRGTSIEAFPRIDSSKLDDCGVSSRLISTVRQLGLVARTIPAAG